MTNNQPPKLEPPSREEFLDAVAMKIFGRSRKDPGCVSCGVTYMEFRDDKSVKEFELTRLCQGCQDTVYGED